MATDHAIQTPGTDLAAPPPPEALPRSLLYATGARIGGTGLDATSLQGATASHRAGILGKAVGYANQQREIPRSAIKSLRTAPVRALSFLPSQNYYAAKRWYLDHAASKLLLSGKFDCFHGWSGDCLRTLIAAKQRDIPTLIDIPTWHRNKGKQKPFITLSDRRRRAKRGFAKLKSAFVVSRQRVLTEYELADVILVPSQRSAETFLDVGTPPEKLHYVGRGVDVDRYRPADPPPPLFRLVFVGALIKRKGVHLLLNAWRRLGLRDAELVLVGTVHDEIKPFLVNSPSASVRVAGFSADVQEHLHKATAFAFPSECEGFAKSTLEAAACGLPLIATRESGDAIVDGETGIEIPPGDENALADAIQHLHANPNLHAKLGAAARTLVAENFTWDHYHARLLTAYASTR